MSRRQWPGIPPRKPPGVSPRGLEPAGLAANGLQLSASAPLTRPSATLSPLRGARATRREMLIWQQLTTESPSPLREGRRCRRRMRGASLKSIAARSLRCRPCRLAGLGRRRPKALPLRFLRGAELLKDLHPLRNDRRIDGRVRRAREGLAELAVRSQLIGYLRVNGRGALVQQVVEKLLTDCLYELGSRHRLECTNDELEALRRL